MSDYIINTRRLGLRFITPEDIELLKDLEKDPDVKEYFPEGTISNREIKEFIEHCISGCAEGFR